MKLISLFSLLVFSLLLLGCASSGGGNATASDDDAAAAEAPETTAKTAYEGATGSGLLMERYKAGQIEGYRD